MIFFKGKSASAESCAPLSLASYKAARDCTLINDCKRAASIGAEREQYFIFNLDVCL